VELEDRIRAAATAGDWAGATTIAIEGYGDELLGYLVAMTGSVVDADDAFSFVAEHLWRSLPAFRWDCSLRTWAYGIARQAIGRKRRDPHRRRAVPLDAVVSAAAAKIRTRTATFLRTESRDRIAALRAQLAPDDQTLLILRVNRKLPWREIARVLADDDAASTDAELTRRAAALRKRFERVKDQLKAQAGGAG
jgi:RNA polymerase sigma-70 factor (ECF subfamily)